MVARAQAGEGAGGWHSQVPYLPLPCLGSHQAAARLQGTGDLMSGFRNALSFPQSSSLSPALITKCFQSRRLCETRPFVTEMFLWVAGRYSAGVCSTRGVWVLLLSFSHGDERRRSSSHTGERCCCLPCQGTGCPASALGGHKAPQCGLQGRVQKQACPGHV